MLTAAKVPQAGHKLKAASIVMPHKTPALISDTDAPFFNTAPSGTYDSPGRQYLIRRRELIGLPAQERGNIEQILRFDLRAQAIAHRTLPLDGRLVQHGVIGRCHR